MSSNARNKIYESVKTLKSFGTYISSDSDDDESEKRIKNKFTRNKTSELFSIDSYIQKQNCTLYTLGPLPILQKCYICSICNPTDKSEDKYICQFCYTNCHQICRNMKKEKRGDVKDSLFLEKNDDIGVKEFFCMCGSEYKHIPPPCTFPEYGPCSLIQLDNALKLDNFYCETHKYQICSVCYVKCHNSCKKSRTQNISQGIGRMTKRKFDNCLCWNECHTKYNEVVFKFSLDKYQELSGVQIWPIQILNILFNNKRTFHRLCSLFSSKLKSEEIKEEEEEKFVSLLELFSNTFNQKFKTFYYHNDILQMFNYETVLKYLDILEVKHKNNIIVKFRIIFIILFIHLRKDFQTVKSLTSIDFLCSNVLQRIQYKQMLANPNIYREHIEEKYHCKELMEENQIIKKIVFKDICRLMEIAIQRINLEKHSSEFEISLKYICFIIKKMMFSKNELILLSHHLLIFFKEFYDYLIKKKPDISKLRNLINGLIEIIFMISVNYNDLVVMDYFKRCEKINKIEKIKPLNEFIHVKSMEGSAIYQIIMKLSDLFEKHYSNLGKNEENKSEGFKDKILNLYNESLSLFSLADNFYYKQLSSISKGDLLSFYDFIKKIEHNEFFYIDPNQKIELDKLIFGLKNDIENHFENLFTSSYIGKNMQINKKLYESIFNFSIQIRRIITSNNYTNNYKYPNKLENHPLKREISDLNLKDSKDVALTKNLSLMKLNSNILNNSANEEIFKNNNFDSNRDFDVEIYGEKDIFFERNLKKFWFKLAQKNKYYDFLKDIIFNRLVEDVVDILIISNVDDTISKILSFLSNRKYPNLLTNDLLDIILSTMSLFFFSKRGMEYFLMGKNLTRINKIINRFNYNSNNKNYNPKLGKNEETNIQIMTRTIDFLHDLCKGIKIYGLSIRGHKILKRFNKSLIQHISTFNQRVNQNFILFTEQLKKIMKIFILLSDDYQFEEFQKIKINFFSIMQTNHNNFLEKDIINDIISKRKLYRNINLIEQNLRERAYNTKLFMSLYMSFFTLLSINSFYVYNNSEEENIIKNLLLFNNINDIKFAISRNDFTLKERYIIMQYIRSLYFTDYLDEYEISNQVNLLTNSEYISLIKQKKIQTEIAFEDLEITNESVSDLNNQNELTGKYNKLIELETILDLFLSEIEIFPNQLINCDLYYCHLYFKELIFDIKFISNYLYHHQKDLFGEIKLLFYKLTLTFLNKINEFRLVNLKINEYFKSNQINFISCDILDNNPEPNDEDWDRELSKIEARINDMKSISFQVYRKTFNCMTESIDSLIKYFGFNQKYNLTKFLEFYDIRAESNFTPFCLIEILDYEYFYDEMEKKDNEMIKHEPSLYKIENLKKSFLSTFIDINNTNFLEVILSGNVDNSKYDYRKLFIKFFLSFIKSKDMNNIYELEIYFSILNKMMFYDSEGTALRFSNLFDQKFFNIINNILNRYTVLVFSLSKNIYAYKLSQEITNLNKLIIQFIQGLGEGFNFTYHNNIFYKPANQNKINNPNDNQLIIHNINDEINNIDINDDIQILNKSIYESLIKNLIYVLTKLDLDNMTDSEMPYDKLIIVLTNITDFLIEYIDSTVDNNKIIRNKLQNLLLTNSNYFLSRIKSEYAKNSEKKYKMRKNIICYTKINMVKLLIYYSLTGEKNRFIQKLIENDMSTINLYYQILYNFYELINQLEFKKPELIADLNKIKNSTEYSKKLIEFYAYEEDFRNMIELQVIFDIFILIRIFEDIYKHNHLSSFFNKNRDRDQENTFDESGEFNMRSIFSIGLYKFLELIILKVVIKMDKEKEDEDDNEESESESENEEEIIGENIKILKKGNQKKKEKHDKISKVIKNQLKRDKAFSNLMMIHKTENPILEDSESSSSDEEVSDEEERNDNTKVLFFPRSYLSFFLNEDTKEKFIDTVDRSNTSSKLKSLLDFSDYCLFEMIVNKHLIGSSKVNLFFSNLDYSKIEIINYIFILIQNLFILIRFYKKTNLSYREYNTFEQNDVAKLHPENYILTIMQMVFLIFFLIVWYFYKFTNCCQQNIMKEYNKPFVAKTKKSGVEKKISQVVVDYFQEKNVSTNKFFNEVNSDLSKWEKIYIYIFYCHLFNREIIMLVLSLILDIVFIITKIPLFIIIQIIFIVNIIQTLFDIFSAIKLTWMNIFLLLLFDFLALYVFAWFGFFFFPNFFIFDDVLIPSSQETVNEGFCFSSLQCYLFVLNRGSLSNGGISEELEKIAYKYDWGKFIGRFFYDVLFFLLISLYIGQMFLCLIIDKFGELREQNTDMIDDKNNNCFICQITRDQCILKNIDFDKHVEDTHNIWNYVYFINYLYVNNPANFNWIENSVWEKLQADTNNWWPYYGK